MSLALPSEHGTVEHSAGDLCEHQLSYYLFMFTFHDLYFGFVCYIDLPLRWYKRYTQDEINCYLCIEEKSNSGPLESHVVIFWDSKERLNENAKQVYSEFLAIHSINQLTTSFQILNKLRAYTGMFLYSWQSFLAFTIYILLYSNVFVLFSSSITGSCSGFVCK